jgi:cytoskeletal protein CcmA (bactofilin family)
MEHPLILRYCLIINRIKMAIFNSAKTGANTSDSKAGAPNIINAGTTILGDLTSDGDMRIDGTVKGYIQCKSRLVLGNTAKVEGDIKSSNLEISGFVDGNIMVAELLTVKSTAKINGDITAAKLIIEAGAEFNGSCSMKDSKNVFKPVAKTPEINSVKEAAL